MMTSCLAAADNKRRFWSYGLVPVLFGAAISTFAAPAAADEATAEALFQAAKTLMDQKKYSEACPKFEASYKIDAAAGTKLNLADCLEKEGKLARAWGVWGEARDQAKRENDKPRTDLAMRRQKELDPRVPRLTVKVNGEVNGLAVWRDDMQLDAAMFGVPLPVDPGNHVVTLRRGKSVLREKKVDVKEKASDEVTIDATGIPAAPAGPSTDDTGSSGNTISTPGSNVAATKMVMVRRSKGLMAGGIVLASLGSFVTLGGILGMALTAGDRDGVSGGAVFTFLLGAGMTTGGIIMAVRGGTKVPRPVVQIQATKVPPPDVFIGPGSIMVRGQF